MTKESRGGVAAGHSSREALIEQVVELEAALCRATGPIEPRPWFEVDLTMSQLKVLFVLAMGDGASGGLRVSDLARQLGVTPATASILLDRLVERGLVERREDPHDRRQHRCRVAQAGQALLAGLREGARVRTRALLSALSEPELETVLQSIEILLRAAGRLTSAEAVAAG